MKLACERSPRVEDQAKQLIGDDAPNASDSLAAVESCTSWANKTTKIQSSEDPNISELSGISVVVGLIGDSSGCPESEPSARLSDSDTPVGAVDYQGLSENGTLPLNLSVELGADIELMKGLELDLSRMEILTRDGGSQHPVYQMDSAKYGFGNYAQQNSTAYRFQDVSAAVYDRPPGNVGLSYPPVNVSIPYRGDVRRVIHAGEKEAVNHREISALQLPKLKGHQSGHQSGQPGSISTLSAPCQIPPPIKSLPHVPAAQACHFPDSYSGSTVATLASLPPILSNPRQVMMYQPQGSYSNVTGASRTGSLSPIAVSPVHVAATNSDNAKMLSIWRRTSKFGCQQAYSCPNDNWMRSPAPTAPYRNSRSAETNIQYVENYTRAAVPRQSFATEQVKSVDKDPVGFLRPGVGAHESWSRQLGQIPPSRAPLPDNKTAKGFTGMGMSPKYRPMLPKSSCRMPPRNQTRPIESPHPSVKAEYLYLATGRDKKPALIKKTQARNEYPPSIVKFNGQLQYQSAQERVLGPARESPAQHAVENRPEPSGLGLNRNGMESNPQTLFTMKTSLLKLVADRQGAVRSFLTPPVSSAPPPPQYATPIKRPNMNEMPFTAGDLDPNKQLINTIPAVSGSDWLANLARASDGSSIEGKNSSRAKKPSRLTDSSLSILGRLSKLPSQSMSWWNNSLNLLAPQWGEQITAESNRQQPFVSPRRHSRRRSTMKKGIVIRQRGGEASSSSAEEDSSCGRHRKETKKRGRVSVPHVVLPGASQEYVDDPRESVGINEERYIGGNMTVPVRRTIDLSQGNNIYTRQQYFNPSASTVSFGYVGTGADRSASTPPVHSNNRVRTGENSKNGNDLSRRKTAEFGQYFGSSTHKSRAR